MAENRISIDIPADTLKEAEGYFQKGIDLISPYLIALSAEDRQNMAKMSDKSEPFARSAHEYMGTNPDLVPRFVIKIEVDKDRKAYELLKPLYLLLSQFFSNLGDTIMLCGSEWYSGALTFYKSVKIAADLNTPDAKVIADDLGKRFAGQGVRKPGKGDGGDSSEPK